MEKPVILCKAKIHETPGLGPKLRVHKGKSQRGGTIFSDFTPVCPSLAGVTGVTESVSERSFQTVASLLVSMSMFGAPGNNDQQDKDDYEDNHPGLTHWCWHVASQLPIVPNHPDGTFTLAADRGRIPVEPVAAWSEAQLIGGAPEVLVQPGAVSTCAAQLPLLFSPPVPVRVFPSAAVGAEVEL